MMPGPFEEFAGFMIAAYMHETRREILNLQSRACPVCGGYLRDADLVVEVSGPAKTALLVHASCVEP